MFKSVFKIAAVPLFLVALAAGYSALWFVGAETLGTAATDWMTARRAAGWTIEGAPLARSGFPLRIRIDLPDARVTAPPESGGWTARADTLRLEAPIWAAFTPRLHAVGPLGLDLGGLGRWQVDGETLDAVLDMTPGGALEGVRLDIEDMHALPASAVDGQGPREDHLALRLDRLTATADRLDVAPPVDIKTATYSLSVTGRGLTLPESMTSPLGREWRELEVTARLLGPLRQDVTLTEAVTQWRDDGGVLEVDRLYVHWPPLEMVLAGTLALDDRLQPVGALSSHVRGFFGAIERLEEVGIIRHRDATMARVVVGSMAQKAPPGQDGGPVLTLPITVQNRQLSAGPVTLMEMPAVRWAGKPPPIAKEIRPGFEIDRFGNVLRRE